MSQWPEPSPEPGEPPRWLGWGVWAVLIGALIWASDADRAHLSELAMPEFAMPEFAMPEFELPRIRMPDLATTEPGPSAPEAAPAGMADANGIAEASPVARGVDVDFDMPAGAGVPFEACLELVDEASGGLASLSVVESSAERRVMRFKTLQGSLTLGCSRVDGIWVERP